MDNPTPRKHFWAKLLLPLLILAAGYAFYGFMVSHPPQIQPREIPPHYPAVEVVEVNPETVTLNVHSQGSVRPRIETRLKPEVAARVIWVSDKLVNGGVFDEGDKLLELDATDYRTALASSESELARAEVEAEHADRELQRLLTLGRKGLASDAQIDQARRSARLAAARLKEAVLQRTQAKTNLERTVIVAPFTGRVREESIDAGQFVSRGEAIATVYASDYYEVRLPIGIEQFTFLNIPAGSRGVLAEEDAPAVTLTGAIGAHPYHWRGILARTEGEIDAQTRLVYGVVRVANELAEGQVPLLVGMFVQADIQGRTVDNIVRLPRSALRDNEQVLVVDADSRLRYRPVQVLRIQGDEVLVQGGLAAGERVCISPLLVVVEGMRVIASVVNNPTG